MKQDVSILQIAEQLTNVIRQADYGHPLDDYTRTAGMFNAAFAHKLKEPMTPEDMMLGMILVKLSRQLNASRRDNLIDICGYANCIDLAQAERERRK